MKFKNPDQINSFLAIVDKCQGDVYLTSQYGDKYNLKSKLSQYIAVAALIGDHAEDLELWCTEKDDEYLLLEYLIHNKDLVA